MAQATLEAVAELLLSPDSPASCGSPASSLRTTSNLSLLCDECGDSDVDAFGCELAARSASAAKLLPSQCCVSTDAGASSRDFVALSKTSAAASAPSRRSASGAPHGAMADQHRVVLVSWMRDVSTALGLQLSTLFSAVALLDRYLVTTAPQPPQSLLQLLALACMSVSVKADETQRVQPSVWLSLAVDPATETNLYTAQDLQRMEWAVLSACEFRVLAPNTLTFLQHFLLSLPRTQPQQLQQKCGAGAFHASGGCVPHAGQHVVERAVMLAEASLLHSALLAHDPASLALACVALADAAPAAPLLRPGGAATAIVAAWGLGAAALAPRLEDAADALQRAHAASQRGGGWA